MTAVIKAYVAFMLLINEKSIRQKTKSLGVIQKSREKGNLFTIGFVTIPYPMEEMSRCHGNDNSKLVLVILEGFER